MQKVRFSFQKLTTVFHFSVFFINPATDSISPFPHGTFSLSVSSGYLGLKKVLLKDFNKETY